MGRGDGGEEGGEEELRRGEMACFPESAAVSATLRRRHGSASPIPCTSQPVGFPFSGSENENG